MAVDSMTLSQIELDKIMGQVTKKGNVFGATICVENGDGSISLESAAGNISKGDSFFIASVTKLYVTTVILKLRSKGLIQLDDI